MYVRTKCCILKLKFSHSSFGHSLENYRKNAFQTLLCAQTRNVAAAFLPLFFLFSPRLFVDVLKP